MKQSVEKKRFEELMRSPVPEPPAELLAALEEEIPADLASAAQPPRRRLPARRWQLVAATLFVAVVGLVVVDRVRQHLPLAADSLADESPAPPTLEEPPPLVAPATGEAAREAPTSGPSPSAEPATGAAPTAAQRPSAPAPAPVAGGEDGGRNVPPTSTEHRSEIAPAPVVGAREAPASAPPKPRFRPPPPQASRRERAEQSMAQGSIESAPAPVPARPDEVARRLPTRVPADAATTAPSTGGRAEPNDRPYGDMFFDSAGVNPFVDTEDDPLSTFGLDVDTGSYTLTRSYLARGHLPPPAAVRVEEFVNFFSYGDRPPARGDFALSAEGAPAPFAAGPRYQIVRFGIHGRMIDRAERRPVVLVFVVDVSGSMGRENRLGLVRRSLSLLLDELYPDDRVGLVIYGSRGEVLLEPSTDHAAVRQAVDRLAPEGSTNAEEGLVLGYQLARRYFREGATNRVILCSDGVANVGRTGPESILAQIAAAAEEGIELTTVGFGMGNYNDVLMERLADRGDGRYAYVDTLAEARRLFVRDLTGTLETIASDAKVQVEFDPRAVERYRLLGYENRDIVDERFRDDTVDAGEIGAGHQVSALYEIKLAPEARPRDRLARLSLRYRSAATGRVEEASLELAVRDLERSWQEASPGLRLAAVVAEFAEILRHSYWARGGDLGDLRHRAEQLVPAFPADAEVRELVELIATTERLQPPSDGR